MASDVEMIRIYRRNLLLNNGPLAGYFCSQCREEVEIGEKCPNCDTFVHRPITLDFASLVSGLIDDDEWLEHTSFKLQLLSDLQSWSERLKRYGT